MLDADLSSTDNNMTSKIHHQLTRSVIGSPSQLSQLTTAAAAAATAAASTTASHHMFPHHQQIYEQSNYIHLEHSPMSNENNNNNNNTTTMNRSVTGNVAMMASTSSIQPGPFAQSPEYMSVQDLITSHNHQIRACVSPTPQACFQSMQAVEHHSPPTPYDVALVEDLRFCFSLRKGSEDSSVERRHHRGDNHQQQKQNHRGNSKQNGKNNHHHPS